MFSILFFVFVAATNPEDPHELFRQIWSPYCKGVSLLECPSSQAQELREQLTTRMQNGEKADQLLKELNAQFEDKLRMAPKTEGRESLAYLLPWIILAVGLVLIFTLAIRKRPKKLNAPVQATTLNKEVQARILQDLNER